MTSTSCALCTAEKVTPWHYEDELCWVADCSYCGVPMVVLKRHDRIGTRAERQAMWTRLEQVAEEHIIGDFWIDHSMRRIEDHYHAHARPMTLPTVDALRERYARNYDRDDLGTLTRDEAVHGWKAFRVADKDPNGRWLPQPVLLGLFQDVCYYSAGIASGCSGKWRTMTAPGRYEHPRVVAVDVGRCDPAPGWGCPARCGSYSSIWLGDIPGHARFMATAHVINYGRVIREWEGDEDTLGWAWRSQYTEIKTLLVAERFCTSREPLDALAGFAERYGIQTYGIANEDQFGEDQADEHGILPVGRFVEAADKLGLPSIHRPEDDK